MRSITKLGGILAGVTLFTSTAFAAGTPEEACRIDLTKAAGKYAQCMSGALAKFYKPDTLLYPYDVYKGATAKCLVKYTSTWTKLQAKYAGTGGTCDSARFDTATAPGTVIDRLTGLQWEQKTNDTTIHDRDNDYTWSVIAGPANGNAFTTFLPALNGASFAGHSDWRLPSKEEFFTVITAPSCGTPPCVDPAFGPTLANSYWTASNFVEAPAVAWILSTNGFIGADNKAMPNYVIAVRALR